MPNAWVEHVKEFARKKGVSYGCAISDPECKSTYKSKKAVSKVSVQRVDLAEPSMDVKQKGVSIKRKTPAPAPEPEPATAPVPAPEPAGKKKRESRADYSNYKYLDAYISELANRNYTEPAPDTAGYTVKRANEIRGPWEKRRSQFRKDFKEAFLYQSRDRKYPFDLGVLYLDGDVDERWDDIAITNMLKKNFDDIDYAKLLKKYRKDNPRRRVNYNYDPYMRN